jgi:hypothetical protein
MGSWVRSPRPAGRPGYLSDYLVRPFSFGQFGHVPDQTRLAVEFEPAEDDGGQPFRCTVHVASIRNLAAYLTHTADVDGRGPSRSPSTLRRLPSWRSQTAARAVCPCVSAQA